MLKPPQICPVKQILTQTGSNKRASVRTERKKINKNI